MLEQQQTFGSGFTNKEGEWYAINNIEAFDSPALVIYKSRVVENIKRLLAMVDQPSSLRPHVKTNKIAEVCQLMLDAGITKFKCATIAEAQMLALIKAPDVLLAYQPVGPKTARLIALNTQYTGTHFSCLVDNEITAREIAARFQPLILQRMFSSISTTA